MKTKLIYLVGLPLLWLAVALIALLIPPDKLYFMAIAPSAWLVIFGGFNWCPIGLMPVAGLPVMCLTGLALNWLKLPLRTALTSSLILTLLLWASLLSHFGQSRALQVPGAPLGLLLSCFNFSLYFLPLVGALNLIGNSLIKTYKRNINKPSATSN